MSCCKTLVPFSIENECSQGYGGIKRLWVACASDLTGIDFGSGEMPAVMPYDDGANYPDSIVGDGLITELTGLTTTSWIQIPIKKNASTFTTAGSGDITTPITVVNTITAVIKGSADITAIYNIVRSQLVCLVQTNSGDLLFIGYFEPAVAIPNYDAGTALTDPSITTLSIVQNDVMPPFKVLNDLLPTV